MKFRYLRYQIVLMLVLCLNYTSAYVLAYIWQADHYFYAVVIAVSFLVGLAVKDYSKSLLYVISTLVVATILGIIVMAAPGLMRGASHVIIDVVVLGYGNRASIMILFGFPLCLLITLMGCFVATSVQ